MAKTKRLSNDELSFFCEQFGLVINAGIPLSEGAEMIADNAGGGNASDVASAVAKNLTDGKNLPDAMEDTGAFPRYCVNMIRIGTLSGRLDDVLRGLSDYYRQMAERRRNVRSAVMHPLILTAMMTVVMIVLIVKVLPMFSDIFGQFNSSVGDTVNASVGSAYAIGTVILVILCTVLVAALIIWLLSRNPSIRRGLAEFASGFILTRKTSGVFMRARFANAMSMMVSSGIEASAALENAALVVPDKDMRRRIDGCRDKVVKGKPFADALDDAGLLPKIYSRSLKMAYQSGSFDESWKKISDRCSTEAEITSENLVSIIEPVLIAVMAVVIGAILLTVMLPMMDIMSALG